METGGSRFDNRTEGRPRNAPNWSGHAPGATRLFRSFEAEMFEELEKQLALGAHPELRIGMFAMELHRIRCDPEARRNGLGVMSVQDESDHFTLAGRK